MNIKNIGLMWLTTIAARRAQETTLTTQILTVDLTRQSTVDSGCALLSQRLRHEPALARIRDLGHSFYRRNQMNQLTPLIVFAAAVVCAGKLHSAEYHVMVNGSDTQSGTKASPFRTIQHAADLAQPGDTITVHAGIYRERINPPRGGLSDTQRITYRAAPGETVEIRGSEMVKGWTNVAGDVWKVVIPNTFFGGFNPYSDLIKADWFDGMGRQHHTGAVYLAGEWLKEAANLNKVLAGEAPESGTLLFNVMSFKPQQAKDSISATSGTVQGLVRKVDTPAGACLGYLQAGSSATFKEVDFGNASTEIMFKVSSMTSGGIIQVLLDDGSKAPIGQLRVVNSGGWGQWQTVRMAIPSTSGRHGVILQFLPPRNPSASDDSWWFGQVDAENTTIHAQFKGVDPNREPVEINVRQSVFYPDQPGRNYITVRGFTMRNAATPWAPPTAEQIGLIGTHWSKGWIIEDNTISYSMCSGITLGKHGDSFDNTSANTAGGYVKTVERAQAFSIPWTKENIGSHMVRNNRVSHCEQAGIVGSMGCAFSTVTGNTVHDINVRGMISGAEMAGIKFHGAIDTLIGGNHIYRCNRGIWLDWMTQGTRVTGNLLHDNASPQVDWPANWEALSPGGEQDMFIEVNHGPILVDNNIFLSPYSVNNRSQGVAFVHNLFAGVFRVPAHDGRMTPYHKPHSTEIVGLRDHPCGDHRFYNNIFVQRPDLSGFNVAKTPVSMHGNVYLGRAKPSQHEAIPVLFPQADTRHDLVHASNGWNLTFAVESAWREAAKSKLVTTESLGNVLLPNQPFTNPAGLPVKIDTDYFGNTRDVTNPFPGPFEKGVSGLQQIRVWTK